MISWRALERIIVRSWLDQKWSAHRGAEVVLQNLNSGHVQAKRSESQMGIWPFIPWVV
jgi:hypothetical protein